jgi:pSer/pThr/pTyr-binding forkhead associated (FHA) protein
LQDDSAYLTTNLLRNQTISLMQPEHIWVIGRDRRVGLAIQDKRLSRRHAMIQYVAGKGFYLVDLNSTNGSYVNSEPVRHPKLLQDGDRIRLGSLSFIFFLCRESKLLESIPAETQAQLGSTHTHSFGPLASADNPSLEQDSESLADDFRREGNNDGEKETSMFLKTPLCQKEEAIDPMAPQLSTAQKADILDRFLNR